MIKNKKKLLFIVPGDSSFKKPIAESFRKLGWDVKIYDYRKGDLLIRIYRFLPYFGGFDKARIAINKKIENIAKSYKPDLVYVNKGESLPNELIIKIKNLKIKTANLFPEYLNYWRMARKLSEVFDYFLVFDKPLEKKLKRIGRKNVYYLPFGAEIEKQSNYKKIYDVSFVGTWRKSRENTLKKLTQFNLNIWGDPRWYGSSLKDFVRGGRVSQKKMKDIIKRSKINLNIYFSGFNLDGAALRVFETTGSGEFLLTEFKTSIEKLYKLDQEVGFYKNPNEMIKKIKFYLSNDQLRSKIANKGYLRANKDHNWVVRIKQLLKIVGF